METTAHLLRQSALSGQVNDVQTLMPSPASKKSKHGKKAKKDDGEASRRHIFGSSG